MTNRKRLAALVTGGSSGIGLAVARALVAAGVDVLICGRDRDRLENARLRLLQSPTPGELGRVVAMSADVANPADCQRLVDRCAHESGGLDVLVHAAGIAPRRPIPETDSNCIEEVFATNAMAAARLIHHAWRYLGASGQESGGTGERTGMAGRIVLISSMASLTPFDGFFAYAASKSAINMLAQCAAAEGAGVGIKAFSVAPGAVETPMLRSVASEEQVPRDRAWAPEVIAARVMDCIQGRAEEYNGKTWFLPSPG